MLRIKKLIAGILLALVVSMYAPPAFAEGPIEIPAVTAGAGAHASTGAVETPGLMGAIILYLSTTLVL